MKKYATNFARMIEDQRKNHSEDDFLDLLEEIKEDLEIKIMSAKTKLDFEPLDELSHLK